MSLRLTELLQRRVRAHARRRGVEAVASAAGWGGLVVVASHAAGQPQAGWAAAGLLATVLLGRRLVDRWSPQRLAAKMDAQARTGGLLLTALAVEAGTARGGLGALVVEEALPLAATSLPRVGRPLRLPRTAVLAGLGALGLLVGRTGDPPVFTALPGKPVASAQPPRGAVPAAVGLLASAGKGEGGGGEDGAGAGEGSAGGGMVGAPTEARGAEGDADETAPLADDPLRKVRPPVETTESARGRAWGRDYAAGDPPEDPASAPSVPGEGAEPDPAQPFDWASHGIARGEIATGKPGQGGANDDAGTDDTTWDAPELPPLDLAQRWVEARWSESPEGMRRTIDGVGEGSAAVADWREVHANYAAIAEAETRREAIPTARRAYVQAYFEAIRDGAR